MKPLKTLIRFLAAQFFVAVMASTPAFTQVSFTTAVDQAIQKSPRVRTAQYNLKKAQAGLAVMKDIFVPSVVLGSGVGTASGITLSVPTIFTVTTQSLIYSPQQVTLIRSARLDLKAATLSLADARDEVAEDAANTYLILNHDQAAVAALSDQFGFALKLVDIIQDRVNAHLDREEDLKKARRDALQMRLQLMQMQDDLIAQRAHLSELTGISEDRIVAQSGSIPDLPAPAIDTMSPTGPVSTAGIGHLVPGNPGNLAAQFSQQARAMKAHADSQYTWKPTISLGAQYGRVSPIENVSEFYNLHGDYNSASVGIQIQFPLLDRVRAAAARVSAADSAQGSIDLQTQTFDQIQQRHKLERSVAELNVKAQIADLNYGIAQDDLQSLIIALHASAGGPPVTPKEEQNAHIQERQKYLEMLDTRLDVSRAEIGYLRQTGQLQDWLQSLDPAAAPAAH